MAWLYHKSATWRKIVSFSAQGPLHYLAFGSIAIGLPIYLGASVMGRTNPEDDATKEKLLRARSSLDHQVLSRVNKERLAVLLGEVQNKEASNDKRYAAALRGESLGTHSSRGSSLGAVAIKTDAE